MTASPLGSAFRKAPPDFGPLAETVNALRDSILAEIRTSISSDITDAIVQAFRDYATPQVTVQSATPPAPVIPPANVTVSPVVTPPNVIIQGEDDAGEIDAMDRQTKKLDEILNQLKVLTHLLMQPVIKEVTRDNNHEIIRVTETR